MMRPAVLLLLAALPMAAAFLPMAAPGRLGLRSMRGVSAPRPVARCARRAAQGCVQLRANAGDGMLDKIDAGEFELLLMV